jgi:hypothetical protein
MSNTRQPLDNLAGRRLPGGCDDCDAYQEIAEPAPGVYVVTVRHDSTCPYPKGLT